MAYATPALAFRWQPIHPLGTLRRSPNISSTVSTQATCSVEHGTYRSGESRAAGWRAGGTSAALGSESRIPWRSLRPCAAGGSLCRARDRVAIGLCHRSQAPAAASLAPIGAVAHSAIARGAAADPCPIRDDRRLGNGHFRSGPYLGSQAPGRHSSARGAADFLAGADQYTATVFAAGGRYWRNGTFTKWGCLGARCGAFGDAVHRNQTFCQRLFHDRAVSLFPSRVR